MEPLDLGNNIFFHPSNTTGEDQTPERHDETTPAPPALVILCTWQGGATTRRIAKYVSGYQQLYPKASILVIRTELADMVYRTFSALHARLKPARDVLSRLLQQHNSNSNRSESGGGDGGNVLLHMLSHGGCNMAIQLMTSLSLALRAALHTRLCLVVADCCPGEGTFTETCRAGLLSLPPLPPEGAPTMTTMVSPRLLQRAVGVAGLYGTVSVVYALQRAGVIKSVPDLRDDLNDPSVFGRRARRLYLASDGDVMVATRHVLSHAWSAEDSGYKVALARFDKAAHCALVLEDPAKYWGAIQGSWAQGTNSCPLPKL